MDQYHITMNGLTPLIMHNDNLAFSEKIGAWRKDPANKELSVKGDDRSPAWTWLSYIYSDTKHLGVPADNLMTMMREGGAKVPNKTTNKSNETYKKQTQSGIMIDGQQFDLYVGGERISVSPLQELMGCNDFVKHLEAAEAAGFELLVKRAKLGAAKHVRVRPMFRQWELRGSLTVIDPELSGLVEPVLRSVLKQAAYLCGLCDWRPSSPKSSGTFGTFEFELERV